MGLFETITSSSNNGKNVKPVTSSSSSPAALPTVIQMHSGSQQPILLDSSNTSCTPSTTLTYQALQVGALPADKPGGGNNKSMTTTTIHVAPDVGVWNCRVPSSSSVTGDGGPANGLVDALLAQMAPDASTFCWTVDLTDASTVEPNISLLQSTLVRHLIQHPPPPGGSSQSMMTSADDSEATVPTKELQSKTKTTSLYDLQAVQFGLATEDPASSTPKTVEEASKDVKISLMICAALPSQDNASSDGDAYRAKQAEALVMYHLRKFANAVNAALCFVPPYSSLTGGAMKDNVVDDSALSPSKPQQQPESTGGPPETAAGDGMTEQSTVSYDKLVQLWRDLALGVPVWQGVDDSSLPLSDGGAAAASGEDASASSPSGETAAAAATAAATALYGPGRQQEDLIETLLLRNANYPGHWEANKDSLWVALPSSLGAVSSSDKESRSVGDAGWLTELRESIASAMPAETISSASDATASAGETKKDDAGDSKDVTDFFQSLISSKK